jgi:hypothetical protein
MKKRFVEKRLMLIKETSFLLVTSHDDKGWVGFALDPLLQTKGGPSLMASSFRVKVFFTVIGWRCSKDLFKG